MVCIPRSGALVLFASLMASAAVLIDSPAHSAVDKVPAEAAEVVQNLQEHLNGIGGVRFTAQITEETVFDGSYKIQFEGTLKVSVEKPASFTVDVRSDYSNRSFWLSDEVFTIFDKDVNVYAQAPATGTYSEAVATIVAQYDADVPMTDLLSGRAYELLVGSATEVVYIGIGNVGDHRCHHIAGRLPEVDWQVWIRAEGDPWLCKYIITDRDQPMAPQYSLRFYDWEIGADFRTTEFQFVAPDGAEKVEFVETSAGESP